MREGERRDASNACLASNCLDDDSQCWLSVGNIRGHLSAAILLAPCMPFSLVVCMCGTKPVKDFFFALSLTLTFCCCTLLHKSKHQLTFLFCCRCQSLLKRTFILFIVYVFISHIAFFQLAILLRYLFSTTKWVFLFCNLSTQFHQL